LTSIIRNNPIISNKNDSTSNAFLAFDGLSRRLFLPIFTFLAAAGGLQ
jgi:hypothetical protein